MAILCNVDTKKSREQIIAEKWYISIIIEKTKLIRI